MKYDKFRGESLQEILMQIRKKYGQNVYILDTKEIQNGGILGTKFLSKKLYEVHIMIPEENSPYPNYTSPNKSYLSYSPRFKKTTEDVQENIVLKSDLKKEWEATSKETNQQEPKEQESKKDNDVFSDFQDIDNLIRSLQKIREEQTSLNINTSIEEKKEIPSYTDKKDQKTIFKIEKPTKEELKILLDFENAEEYRSKPKEEENVFNELSDKDVNYLKIREKLLKSEFSQEFTNKFFQVLKRKIPSQLERNPIEFHSFIIKEIAKFIYYDPEIHKSDKTKVIFFVGPNGSGKTTSLAKLSAKLKLENHFSLSIMSLDDYRLAATEQLKTYSQILDVP
ncbi:MAG: hypothetical protein ACK4UJ_11430, partial [Leptonema sp. (in: bacteria)]